LQTIPECTTYSKKCVLVFPTLREEHRLRVFENRVLRRIFVPQRHEVTGDWRKLHNEELHNLYSSPSIIRMIKSRRMRWAGHVERMGRSGIHIGYQWESRNGIVWIGFIWLRIGTNGGLL
jgi:hypothetical protein